MSCRVRRRAVGKSSQLLQNASWYILVAAALCYPASEAAAEEASTEDSFSRPDDGAGVSGKPVLSADASADDIYAAIFGTAPPVAPTLAYPVQLIGMNKGDVEVTPASTPELTLVDRRAIVDLLMPILTQERQTEILRSFTDRPTVSAAELTALGYDTRFDDANLTLVMDVPLHYRSIVPIPMQQRYNNTSADVLSQAKTSAIVNVFAGTTYVHDSVYLDKGFAATEANLDAAFNYRNFVLETGLRYAEDASQSVTLSDTRLTYDFAESMIRTEAGDLTVPTSGLQGNPSIGGISAYREFRLKPEYNYRANPSQEFELQRDARVSVYINGQFVRDFRLQSGRYNLTDLPLRSGSGNDVILEILYDTGEIERVVFTAFYDFELLKKGTSEFAFSAGPVSEITQSQRRYDTDNIAFSGYYRLGITDQVTLGGSAQFDDALYNAGAEAILASKIGLLGATVAYSDHNEVGAGSAATLSYRWAGDNVSEQLRVNLQARFQDRNYRRLGSASGSGFKYDVAARVSAGLSRNSRVQASLGFRQNYDDPREEYSASVSGSRDLGRGSLSATINYYDNGEEPEWNFGLSYTIRLGNIAGQAAHDSRNRTTRLNLVHQGNTSVDTFGYDVSYMNDPSSDEIRAGLGYTGNRFDGRVEQRYRNARSGDDHSTNFYMGSALVYADGHAALSRPVTDSFAMFGVNRDAGKLDIAVEPNGGVFGKSTGYAARSSGLGPAVLSDLQSYYLRSVTIEAPGAPPGVSVGNDVFTFKPSYRGGYIVEVGSDRNVSAMGRLVDLDGEVIPYASGYAVTADGERQPFFSNAGGRFYVENLKSGETVRLELDSPKGAWVELSIPKDSLGVYRLTEDVVINRPPPELPFRIANFREKGEF